MELSWTLTVLAAVFVGVLQEGRAKSHKKKEVVKSRPIYADEEITTTEDPLQQILPLVTFECTNRTGYYADVQFNCEVFHYCKADGSRFTFLCPPTSRFNQKYMICDYESADVDLCGRAKRYFSINDQIFPTDDSDVFIRTSSLKNPIKKTPAYKYPSGYKKTLVENSPVHQDSRYVSQPSQPRMKPTDDLLRGSSTTTNQRKQQQQSYHADSDRHASSEKHHKEPLIVKQQRSQNNDQRSSVSSSLNNRQVLPPNQQSIPQVRRPHQSTDPGTSYAYFQFPSSETSDRIPSQQPKGVDVIKHPSPALDQDARTSLDVKNSPQQEHSRTKHQPQYYQRPNNHQSHQSNGSAISSFTEPSSQPVVHSYFELNPQTSSGKEVRAKQSPSTLDYLPKLSHSNFRSDHRDFAQSSPPTIRAKPGSTLAFSAEDSIAEKSKLKNIGRSNSQIYPEGSLYTWNEEKKIWIPWSPEQDSTQYGLRTRHISPSLHSVVPEGYGADVSSILQQHGKSQKDWTTDHQSKQATGPLITKPPTTRKRYTLKKDPIAQLYEAEFKKLKKKDESKTVKLIGEETHPFGISTSRGEYGEEESRIISSFPIFEKKYDPVARQVPLDTLPAQSSHGQLSLPLEVLLDHERSLPLESHGQAQSQAFSPSSVYSTYSDILGPHFEPIPNEGHQGEVHKRRRKRQLSSSRFFNQPFGNQLLNSFSNGGSFNPFTSNPFRNSFFPEFGSSAGFGNAPFLPSIDGSVDNSGLNLNSFGFPESLTRQLTNRGSNTRGTGNRGGTSNRDTNENNDRVNINIDIANRHRRPPGVQGPRPELPGSIPTGRLAPNGPTRPRPEGPPSAQQTPLLPLREAPPPLQQPIELIRSIIQNPPELQQPIRRLPNQQYRGPQSFQGNGQQLQNGLQYRPSGDIYPRGPPPSRVHPFVGEVRLSPPPQEIQRGRPFNGDVRPPSPPEEERRQYDNQNIVGPRYTVINHPIPPPPPQRPVPPSPSTQKPNIYLRPERRPSSAAHVRRTPSSGAQRAFQDVNGYPHSVYSPEDPLRVDISINPSLPGGNRGHQQLTVQNNRVSQAPRDTPKPTRATPPPRSRPSVSYQEPQLPPATSAPAPPSYDPFPTRGHEGLFITEPPNLSGQYPNYYRFAGEGQQNEFNLPSLPNLDGFPTRNPEGYYITEPPNLLQAYTPHQEPPVTEAKKENEQTQTEPPSLYIRPLDIEEPRRRKPPQNNRASGGRYTAPTPGRKRRPRPQNVNFSSRPAQETTEPSIPATEPPEQHVLSPPLDQSPFTPPALYGPPNSSPVNVLHREVGYREGSYATEKPLVSSYHDVHPPSPPSLPAPPSYEHSSFSRGHQIPSLYQPQTESPNYYYEPTTTSTTPAPSRGDGRTRHRQGNEYRRKPEKPIAKIQEEEEEDIPVVGFDEVPFGTRISGARNRNAVRAKVTTTNRPRRIEATSASDNRGTTYRQQRRTTETIVYLDRTPVLPTTTPKPATRRPHRRRPQQGTPTRRPASDRYFSSSDLSGSQSYHSSQPVPSERQHSPLEVSIHNNGGRNTTNEVSGRIRNKPSIVTVEPVALAVPDPSELANHRLTPLVPDKSNTESVSEASISPEDLPSVSIISNSNVDKSPSSSNLPLRPPRPRIRQKPREDTSSRVIYNPPPTFSPPLQNEDRRRIVATRVSSSQNREVPSPSSQGEAESSSTNKEGSSSLFGRRPRPTLPPRARKVTTRKPITQEETTFINDLSLFSTLTPMVQTSISVVRSVPRIVENAFQHVASITTTPTPDDSDKSVRVPSPQRVFSSKNGGSYQSSPQRVRSRLRQRKNRLNSATKSELDLLNGAESSRDVVTVKDTPDDVTTIITTDIVTSVSDFTTPSSSVDKPKETTDLKGGA